MGEGIRKVKEVNPWFEIKPIEQGKQKWHNASSKIRNSFTTSNQQADTLPFPGKLYHMYQCLGKTNTVTPMSHPHHLSFSEPLLLSISYGMEYSLVSLSQLSLLCPLTAFFPPLAYLLVGQCEKQKRP